MQDSRLESLLEWPSKNKTGEKLQIIYLLQ